MILSNDNKYHGELGKSLRLNEYSTVEKPCLEQLKGLGWEVVELNKTTLHEPSNSFRDNFSQVVLLPKLREALRKINPFLTEGQVDEKVRQITTFHKSGLLENNEQVFNLLLNNTTVSRNEQTGELSPTVRFIDFEELKNNSFTAISQFKVKITGTDHHIIPDIVLFVNGLPFVVIEAKSPRVKEPIDEAIDQLMRYSEQRGYKEEGNQELFYYNQFIITTCRVEAKFGTISTHIPKYFFRWSDPYPRTLADLEHGRSSPNDQTRLIAGMLDKRNLLDIVRVFTLFKENDAGKKIKIVGRYQQFRAVKVATKRLLNGNSKWERGGIIWHTQGSGKSLTMMFMVREMRLITELQSWKIVFVTDRTQLEEQLEKTGNSVGFTIQKAEFINEKRQPDGKSLKELLRNDNSDIVMAMIHKFQENDELKGLQTFPVLNENSHILIMTDEAHRSQFSLLGANLDKALPNATSIGYTGTPTDKTESKYRDYIDKYTMKQAEDDGVILRIVYEGFTHNAEIPDKEGMDDKFEDVFSDYNLTERLKILGFASRDAYLDSKNTIKEKAQSMINHYVENVFSNKFKAQVVANSREATVRYKNALDEALQEKIKELEEKNPLHLDIEVLKKLEIAVIISGIHNDKKHLIPFTKKQYHTKSIDSFKLPFEKKGTSGKKKKDKIIGNVGILIVTEMLITGFDAPIEQVMYLDKKIVSHNLLQAIARVNRIYDEDKGVGFIVDYIGVGDHLPEAMEVQDEREVAIDKGEIPSILESLVTMENELNELKRAHKKIWDFLKKNKLEDLTDIDAFYDVFYDEDIRFEYLKLYKKFTKCFNNVMPRKEALDFYDEWLSFTAINELANKHFRDKRFSMKGIPEKLRGIADEFLRSKGIDRTIEPISITSEDFQSNVKKRKRQKTKAAEVEHAIRNYIDINLDDDPELFASFSKELQEILLNFKDNWSKIYQELEKLREKIKNREKEETYGLNRKRQMPFFRIYTSNFFGKNKLNENDISRIVDLTQKVFNLLSLELKTPIFWDSPSAQNRLKQKLQELFIGQNEEFYKLPNMMKLKDELISRTMETAKKLHYRIIENN